MWQLSPMRNVMSILHKILKIDQNLTAKRRVSPKSTKYQLRRRLCVSHRISLNTCIENLETTSTKRHGFSIFDTWWLPTGFLMSHPKKQPFLKDVMSSRTQYFDTSSNWMSSVNGKYALVYWWSLPNPDLAIPGPWLLQGSEIDFGTSNTRVVWRWMRTKYIVLLRG